MTRPRVPVSATILAAGLGRRLGHRPKAALQINGVSLLERLSGALQAAEVAQVNVVLGAYLETLLPLAQSGGALPLTHRWPDTSLVDSQRLALAHHHARHPDHDLLLVLADLPLLGSTDIAVLIEAWQQRPAFIHAQMPLVDGVRGHPLILSAAAVQQVLAMPAEVGIRAWLDKHPHLTKPVVSTCRAYTTDLDTHEDLAALKAALAPQAVCWLEPWGDDDAQPWGLAASANTSRAAVRPLSAAGKPA